MVVKLGNLNVVLDILSRIHNDETSKINDDFPGAHLFWVEAVLDDIAKI